MVTMFHYDLPQELQKLGGFTNPLFLRYFERYAQVLYDHFGDRVKYWITFNEPMDYCLPGYGHATYPPQIYAPGVADYLCIDNTIKAHALAYRLYRKKYFKKFQGKIGITLSGRFYYSKTNNTDLVDRGFQFGFGWLAHPIHHKTGGYPEIMIEEIGRNSLQEGREWSRLPEIDKDWIELIQGSSDFLGINYYTTRYIENADPPEGQQPSWQYDTRFKTFTDPKWKRAKSSWLYVVPQGLEDLLKYLRDEYDNVEVIITENGYSDDGELIDLDRIDYLKQHLKAVLNAIEDGCNVSAYTHWSLIDNFEWLHGYVEKFGLYAVNMSSISRERVPKKSAGYYSNVIRSRSPE